MEAQLCKDRRSVVKVWTVSCERMEVSCERMEAQLCKDIRSVVNVWTVSCERMEVSCERMEARLSEDRKKLSCERIVLHKNYTPLRPTNLDRFD
jgi:hypothetical protein